MPKFVGIFIVGGIGSVSIVGKGDIVIVRGIRKATMIRFIVTGIVRGRIARRHL